MSPPDRSLQAFTAARVEAVRRYQQAVRKAYVEFQAALDATDDLRPIEGEEAILAWDVRSALDDISCELPHQAGLGLECLDKLRAGRTDWAQLP